MSGVLEEIKSGFTTKAIVLAIILGIIGLFANISTWWAMGISLEPVFAGRIGSPIYPPYGLVFLLALASVVLAGAGLTVQEITVVTTIAFVAADSPFVIGGFLQFIFAGTYLAKTNANVAALLNYYPGLWTPGNYDLISPAWLGGASAPLGSLFPYLAFWMFITLLWCLLMVFHAAILRLQLIKKERLPFPMMVPVNEMLSHQRKNTFMSYIRSVPFLAGLLIGGLIGVVAALNYIIKPAPFPIFYAFGQFYLTPVADIFNAISQRTISSWWQFIPADAVVLYLAPLDILSSIVVYLVIFQVIFPLVLVNTGVITPGTNPAGAGPFPWSTFSNPWAVLAIGVWTVIFGYKTYAGSISNALQQAKAGEGELSDLLVWGGFVVTWAAWLVIWTIIGGNILLLLFGFAVWLLYQWGIVAVFGATGTWVGGADATPVRTLTWKAGTFMGSFPSTGAAAKTQSAWATMAGTTITANLGSTILQNTHAQWAYTGTYTMAEPSKTKETSIFMAQIVGILITVLIGFPFAVYIIYGTGIGKLKAWGLGSGAQITGWQIPYVWTDAAPPADYNFWMAPLAIVVVGILFYLRSQFSWFFFSPYALFFYSGMWLINGGLAWVLKVITLKVFGAKAYEEVGVPVAIGFLAGATLVASILMGVNSVTGGISVAPTGY